MSDKSRRDAAEGRRLVTALTDACHETNGPIVPTPVALAIRNLRLWRDHGAGADPVSRIQHGRDA